MIACVYVMTGMERAAVVVMMPSIAMMPVPIMCPTMVNVPPIRVVTPIPRTMPSVPCIAPKPIVDIGSIDVNGFDDIGCTIHILVTYYLYRYIVARIFLYVYRGYILVDILRKNGLQNDEALVAFTGLDNAQIVHLPVAVEVEVAECAVRVVEHRLELFQVLSLRKKLSYNLQIESFRDVRTVEP